MKIVRGVRVDRTRTPQEVLDATGREQYCCDFNIVKNMPRGEGEEVEVYFVNFGCVVRHNNLEQEYAFFNLELIDPYSLAAVNEDFPNCTHWKDSTGNWCHMIFDRWNGRRGVSVGRYEGGCDKYWWHAGRRRVVP
ncbi:MAG: hypothetical protein AAB565_00710 [Patescibacteria group bacterium]